MARPPAVIQNGDFEKGLQSWHVISGKAFAGQPVAAATIGAEQVRIQGRALVGLGGDFWHVPYPIGQNGAFLIRTVSAAGGVLESAIFSIAMRFLAYRLGGTAGGGAAIELRVPAKAAKAAKVKALDKPDKDGYVAVHTATPTGSDVLHEGSWDLAGRGGQPGLVGTTGKVRLRIASGAKNRLLADYIRMVRKPPPRFHPPLWGWADIHCHPMAQAGFGDVLSGHMHGPVEDLDSCLPVHGHEHGNILHPVSLALEGGRHNDGSLATTGWTTGTPAFDEQMGFRGWPAFDEITHIKTHQAWIRRAYDGGQRLMVALIVHNQMLASLSTATRLVFEAQSDRDTVEPQVQVLREFIAHNKDWCGLATKPSEARDLIEQNKMAFVLGLETDSINGWIKNSDFPTADSPANRQAIHDAIHDYFDYLTKLGVVQVNLIHLSNNAFGGMALYDVMFVINSWQRTGVLPDTEDGFNVHPNPDERISTPVTLASALWEHVEPVLHQLGFSPPAPSGVGTYGQGDRNKSGLTLAGEVALVEAMRLGMVIDMDHMSEKSSEKAHEIATKQVPQIYPLVSAHNGARKLAPRPPAMLPTPTDTPGPGQRRAPHTWPSESMKSETQLDWIKETGGMFGHGIAGSDSLTSAGTSVPNDCPGSSKTVAQGLQYLITRLEMPVALGTDWNALLPGPSPRFGPRAASGLIGELKTNDAWAQSVRMERLTDALVQASGVLYDTPVRDWRSYRFPDSGLYDDALMGAEARFIWQAKALISAGEDLTKADVIAALAETGYAEAPALELALGLKGNAALPGNVLSDFNRAGVVSRTGVPVATENAHVQHLVEGIVMVDDLWMKMTGGTAPPMKRSTAGPVREFDYNLDGLSHYGLLPDMLQDLKNVGLTSTALTRFFQSAERYVEVWERSVAAGLRIPHP